MLIKVFSDLDGGFESLIQLTDEGEIELIQSPNEANSVSWTSFVKDIQERMTQKSASGMLTIMQDYNRYASFTEVPESVDFDTAYEEGIAHGATTGKLLLTPRKRE